MKRADMLGDLDADQLHRDTSYLAGVFWQRIRAQSEADEKLKALSNSSTVAEAEAALGASAFASRQSEQAVVNALFTTVATIQPEGVALNRAPLRDLPLLLLLGDALKPLVDDLDGLALYHDIACQFEDCRAPVVDTPSRRAWDILSALESPTLPLRTASNTKQLGGWKAVFSKIASKQSVLTDAVPSATSKTGGLGAQTREEDVHPLARQLWLLLRHANAFQSHYETTGLFDPSAQGRLVSALLQETQQNVANGLQGQVANLGSAVSDYKNGLLAAVQAQLAVIDAGAKVSDLQAQRLRKVAEMQQKADSLEGLRDSGVMEDAAFSDIAKSFADVQASLDTGKYMEIGDTREFELDGQSGLYTGSNTLPAIAAQAITALQPGQLLVINTSGAWTPTCSLDDEKFIADTTGVAEDADLSDAIIGPEGYTLVVNGSTTSAHSASKSKTSTSTIGVSARFCVGSGIVVKAEGCLYADKSWSTSSGWVDSESSESKTSAAFATGLRLETTPFPAAPVGSLLVVLTNPDSGAIRDVRIVHGGATSVLIEQASNAYFVVNDKLCTTASKSNKLLVTVRAMQKLSSAPFIAQILGAMSDVLSTLRTYQANNVAKGAMLPSEATLIRQSAAQALQMRLGSTSASDLPPILTNLFDAFVTHEIVGLERRIQILAVQRSLDLDLFDLRMVDDELLAGAAHARLQKLIPQWLLRDLDHDQLRNQLIDLLSIARDRLKPAMELWYPQSLKTLAVGEAAANLRGADIDTPLTSLASDGQTFVNALISAYRYAEYGGRPNAPQLPVVVVSFPRPGKATTNVNWREADAARAKAVWDAIDKKTTAHFDIFPEDFYSPNGGNGILNCYEVVPVIKTMALYAVRPGAEAENAVLNGLGRTFVGFSSATQRFVTLDGPRVYQLTDPDQGSASVWQHYSLPVRYGDSDSSLLAFQAMPRQTRPIGLSATGIFDLDFSILNTLNQGGKFGDKEEYPVTEVQLLLEIDSRPSATRPTWIDRCK